MPEDLEDRIRRRAYEIWERHGRPEGRHDDHWTLAKEEIAIEDNYQGTLMRNPSRGPDDTAERSEPVEPVLSMESQGEMPGLHDQGEEFQIPGYGDRSGWPEEGGRSGTRDRETADSTGAAGAKPRRATGGKRA